MKSAVRNEDNGHRALFILILDMGISLLSSLLSVLLIRFLMDPFIGFRQFLAIWLGCSAVCSLAGFMIMGTHKIVIRYATIRSLGKIAWAAVIKVVLLVPLFFLLKLGVGYSLSLLGITDFLMTIVLLILVRVFMIVIYDDLNTDIGRDVDRLGVAVYGVSDKSVSMVIRLESSPNYKVLCFLSRNPEVAGQIIHNKPVYSFVNAGELAKIKINLGVDAVVLPKSMSPEDLSGGLLEGFLEQNIHVLTMPQLSEVDFGGYSQHSIQSFSQKDDFIPDGMSAFERKLKRGFDCLLSGILLLIFSPLFLFCWIAIKLDDGGPAIYSQERMGRFGRPFKIHKFRSMRTDAESMGPALYSGGEDPRLTKVGKFLREHHLDELPQLWNVFNGDMAFIGYRPERQFYIDQIMEADPRYYYLYQIRPGVTSYATLHNGYTDTLDKMLRRLELDLYYLRNRSIWFDIKILAGTFLSIVSGKKF